MTDLLPPVLACRNLRKDYRQGPETIHVLRSVQFAVEPGERVAIMGQSGSGKSTLLNLLGGLDLPTDGEVLVDGCPMQSLNEGQRGELRNRKLGFVYQFHHLMMEFSAEENVAMPLLIRGETRAAAVHCAVSILDAVGMGNRCRHRPSALSGGERQRVAIARALVTEPRCVLMDEPTGNLDEHNAAAVQELMLRLNDELGTGFVVVTHDSRLARSMDRVLILRDGNLHEE